MLFAYRSDAARSLVDEWNDQHKECLMIRFSGIAWVLGLTVLLFACADVVLPVEEDKATADISDIDVHGALDEALDDKADVSGHPYYRGNIDCGGDATGMFDSRSRYHLWTFLGREGMVIDIDLGETDGYTDTLLALFGLDYSRPLAVNDDCEPGTYDSCLHSFELPNDGEYVVLTTTYRRSSRGSYALSLQCTGTGVVGDPCDSDTQCGADLFCAIAPDSSSGECMRATCAHDNECPNAVCLPAGDEPGALGWCWRPTDCDDGQPIRCRQMIPNCEAGTILAYQNGCYTCVDRDTCEPPAPVLDCAPRGCSGQICGPEPMVTTCEWRPEYGCLREATCGQIDDACGWKVEFGGPAHECFLELGRCVFDEDCSSGQVCGVLSGAPWGMCEGDEPVLAEEGAPCNDDTPCAEGLHCIGRPHDGSADFGACRNTSHLPGEGEMCSAESDCAEGLICTDLTHADQGSCVPDWMAGTFIMATPTAIPDNDANGVETSVVANGLATVPTDVELDLKIRHTWVGDLRVTIVDPNGQEAVVWDRSGGSSDDIRWRGPVNAFSMDDSVNGRWTLRVSDHAAYDEGVIEGWSLYLISRWD